MSLQIEMIETANTATDKGNVFITPASSAVLLPELFDGRSNCLLEWCYRTKGHAPKTVLFATKSGVYSDKAKGWVCHYSDSVKEVTVTAEGKRNAEPRGRPPKREKRIHSSKADEFSFYGRLFYSSDEDNVYMICNEVFCFK